MGASGAARKNGAHFSWPMLHPLQQEVRWVREILIGFHSPVALRWR
jgi:hypothetical protein